MENPAARNEVFELYVKTFAIVASGTPLTTGHFEKKVPIPGTQMPSLQSVQGDELIAVGLGAVDATKARQMKTHSELQEAIKELKK